ncbi:hypothetical protein JOM56_006375 [Amanita muscaria]
MTTVQSLLGLRLSSPILAEYIASIASNVSIANATVPEVKAYSDVVYLNYFALGLSLLLAPQGGYKPASVSKLSELDSEKLVLESIDMYNALPAKPSKTQPAFATFAALPVVLSLAGDIKNKEGEVITRQANILVSADSTGKDFVAALHEPDRKGGGAGPSTGSIGIWCEWTMDGIMVEFGGEEAKGPQAWERGKDACWRVLTTFQPDKALH